MRAAPCSRTPHRNPAAHKRYIMQSIDVTKLIKAKPLDNIEFMQWLKSYFDRVTASQGVPNYDAAGRRSATKGGATGLRTGGPAGAMRANSSRAGAKCGSTHRCLRACTLLHATVHRDCAPAGLHGGRLQGMAHDNLKVTCAHAGPRGRRARATEPRRAQPCRAERVRPPAAAAARRSARYRRAWPSWRRR